MMEASAVAERPAAKRRRRMPANLDELVLAELCARMDPATRLVEPRWRIAASSLGVSAVTLAKSIRRLKEGGFVATVDGVEDASGRSQMHPAPASVAPSGRPRPLWLPNASKRYLISETVDAARAASVEPRFPEPQTRTVKRRYAKTRDEMDAAASARLAVRARLVMDDLAARMDPATRIVAPRVKEMAARIGHGLTAVAIYRILHALTAAGVIVHKFDKGMDGTGGTGSVFEVAAAPDAIDYSSLADVRRISNARADKQCFRRRCSTCDFADSVLDYLRGLMDAETRLVKIPQRDLAAHFGCSQRIISKTLRSLVASARLTKITRNELRTLVVSARLAKITRNELRSLGADADIYRIIPPSQTLHTPSHLPPIPASPIFTNPNNLNFAHPTAIAG